jgi:hypothetical protein
MIGKVIFISRSNMSYYVGFAIKGSISDTDYNRLLNEKSKDILGNQIVVGDKVAYATASKYAGTVSIGEIENIWLEYSLTWDSTTRTQVPNMNYINIYVKIKGIKKLGTRGVTRYANGIVKVA